MVERNNHAGDERNIKFSESATQVAEQLRGITLQVEENSFNIVLAEGFDQQVIKLKIFQGAMQDIPGMLTAVPYRASLLPNITVGDRGLVMIRAVSREKEDGTSEVIIGPGRVAKAFGLTPHERWMLNPVGEEIYAFRLESDVVQI
jgi:hypothetical protein